MTKLQCETCNHETSDCKTCGESSFSKRGDLCHWCKEGKLKTTITKESKQEKWEKEFDKTFLCLEQWTGLHAGNPPIDKRNEVKEFIRITLTAQKEKMIGEMTTYFDKREEILKKLFSKFELVIDSERLDEINQARKALDDLKRRVEEI